MRLNFIGTCSVVVMRRTVFERVGNFRKDISGPGTSRCGGERHYLARALLILLRYCRRHKDLRSMSAQNRMFAGRI